MAGKRKFHKAAAGLITAAMILGMASFYSASAFDPEENAREQKKIAQENEEYKKQIEEAEKSIADKEKYSQELQDQISDLTKKIKKSNDRITELNNNIKENQKKIDEKLGAIDDRLNLLKDRLRTIYTAGDISTLEIVLQAKNFSDFIDKMELVKSISAYDTELINGLKDELKKIGKEQQKLRNDKASVEKEKKSLEQNKKKINDLSAENEEIIAELKTEKEKAENSIAENEKRQDVLQKALDDYNKELAEKARIQRERQKQREAERKARAEAAKKKAEEQTARQNQENNNDDADTDADSDADDEDNYEDEQYIDISGNYVWPCPGHTYLTSTFDEWRGANNHGALDIADGNIYGASVVACWYGTVFSTWETCTHDYGKFSSCGCGGGYGNYVMIDHGGGKISIYGHLSGVTVSPGDEVVPGQLIGFVGSTGYSTGPHLHFEMQYNGVRYDPLEEYN